MHQLTPIDTLPEQDWLRDKATKKLMSALEQGADNAELPVALFVGGCVRDALIGKAVHDIDLATSLKPEQVIAALEAANIKAIPTGLEHGTITAVIKDKSYEITTLRRDIETDGRHAEVAFTSSWKEDAQRRDFTINTLLCDGQGRIYDPLGCALDDLKARRIIFVGEAQERIKEDHLRIMRFFRFYALYGEGTPDEEALKACQEQANSVYELSKERITQEFIKIIMCEQASAILALMFDCGVLKALKFASYRKEILDALCAGQTKYALKDMVPRLWALCGFDADNLKSLEQYVMLSKKQKREIKGLAHALEYLAKRDEQAVKVALYRCGRAATIQALILQHANGTMDQNQLEQGMEFAQSWVIPTFPVSGNDLIAKGIKPGPELGAELNALEQNWIDRGFTN